MWWLVQRWTHDPNQVLTGFPEMWWRLTGRESPAVIPNRTMLHTGGQLHRGSINMVTGDWEMEKTERWTGREPWNQVNSRTFPFSKLIDSPVCISWLEFSLCHLQPKEFWWVQSQSSNNSYLINCIIIDLITKEKRPFKKQKTYQQILRCAS